MERENEYYSNCCDAPPLFDPHENVDCRYIGVCMKCRDGAQFWLLSFIKDKK